MKHYIARTALGTVSIAILYMTLVPAAQADDTCSTAKAAGDWGGTLTGTLILPTGGVPSAAVFAFNTNTAGKISGTEARNVGGGFANETLEGTLNVNPDCTGTASFSVFESGVLVRKTVFSVVFDDNSTELRAVEQSLVLEPSGTAIPAVITVDGKKLSSED